MKKQILALLVFAVFFASTAQAALVSGNKNNKYAAPAESAKSAESAETAVAADDSAAVKPVTAEDMKEEAAPAPTPAPNKPTLNAKLLDMDNKAARGSATVEADVSGLEVSDPSEFNEQAKPGHGHLHYQVDDGPVIATTARKLSFHGLKAGAHTIVVSLAGNDHKPLGPEQKLTVNTK